MTPHHPAVALGKYSVSSQNENISTNMREEEGNLPIDT
jgi:hypothetical protein